MNEDGAPRFTSVPDLINTPFEVTLKMLSDWHVGSGAGRPGNIDSLVRRDPDGLPYVPAKTLTGIWRDACERVALGLDDGNKTGVWNRWVDYLFGDQPAIADAEWRLAASQTDRVEKQLTRPTDEVWQQPRRAALSIRSAYLPPDLRQALESKPVAREAVTFVKPGISIHPLTGSARTDFLRFEEMARGGVSLAATCELRDELTEDQRHIASSLFIAGAQMVERLGGKRRRGAGRCTLTVAGYSNIEPWLDWIEAHPQPDGPPSVKSSEPTATNDGDTAASGDWLRLGLILKTKLPVIVPAGTIGNLIETLDYIPGTYLLPHITQRLNDVNARTAIARGDLVVTDATIEVENEKGRPVPFSLAYPKTGRGLKDGRDVFNQLCEVAPQKTQWKNHREGYVGSTLNSKPGGTLPTFDKVDPQVETHNVVKDDVQRPTEEVGGVYSYQSIPPGVTLRGELRLRQSLNDALSQKDPTWFSKLEGELRLGRASKDDYGSVELGVIGQPELVLSKKPIGEELTVWLLSDVLLRDDRLRPTGSIESLRRALQDRLNLGRDGSQTVTLEQRLHSAFPRQRRTDSWHVGWGLPRPSLAGLQAGSCAVFKIEGQIDQSRLAEIEAGGIGERRAEGYGQVCFNDPLVTSKLDGLRASRPTRDEKQEGISLVSGQSSLAYAQLIEHQAARNEMRRSALGFAATRDNRKKALGVEIIAKQSKPRMSQLGALRSALSRLQSAADSHRAMNWINHLAATANRRNQWPTDSLAHVEELITQTERVWQLLDLDFTKLVLTENGAEELKHKLWPEAVRTLVDACVRAQKRDLEGE